jgi:glycosyltransferase involved in cell wall biosynthesis
LKLQNSVIFAGQQPISILPQYIDASDVCVYFPREGFMGDPLKLREFMAMGKPFITVNQPNYGEYISRENTGLVVEPNEEIFGYAIANILDDPDKATILGKKGKEVVEEMYDWKVISNKIISITDSAFTDFSNPYRHGDE